jgi:hypothetical protein
LKNKEKHMWNNSGPCWNQTFVVDFSWKHSGPCDLDDQSTLTKRRFSPRQPLESTKIMFGKGTVRLSCKDHVKRLPDLRRPTIELSIF